MSSSTPATLPCLQQLPPDVLRMVWQQLKPSSENRRHRSTPLDLQALRCTCKALRDSITPDISFHWIEVGADVHPENARDKIWRDAVHCLSRFPASAVLRKLSFSCYFHTSEFGLKYNPQAHHHGQLAVFLQHAPATRVSSLTTIALDSDCMELSELTALVDTCPHLQSIKFEDTTVFGPAFAPLQRLTSLSSLTFKACSVGSGVHPCRVVLASLPPLTALTRLVLDEEACYDPASNEAELKEAEYFCNPAIFALPWLSSLHELRDLHISMFALDRDAAGEALAQHLCHLQHLTSLHVSGCVLPSDCSPLAFTSSLARIELLDQELDTYLTRLFAALPSLQYLFVEELQLNEDLSALPLKCRELEVMMGVTLQQLLWLPRGIQSVRTTARHEGVEWRLTEGDSLDSIHTYAQRIEQLFAEKPGWRSLLFTVIFETAPAVSCFEEHQGGAEAVPGGQWSGVFQALAPIQTHLGPDLLHLTFEAACRVSAETARQGMHWLPSLRMVILHPLAPGAGDFVEALRGSAWPGWLALVERPFGLDVVDAAQVLMASLKGMVEQRASKGYGLMVLCSGWLSVAQSKQLDQAAAQHCKPGHEGCVRCWC